MTNITSNSYSNIVALLPSLRKRISESEKMIIDHYEKAGGYVAWSGGKDSTCVAFMAKKFYSNIPIVWFDSGLEFPENRDYIFRIAEQYNFNLEVVKPKKDALTFLKESGFWSHSKVLEEVIETSFTEENKGFHENLVSDPSKIAHSMFGLGEMLGMRADESRGRKILLSKYKGEYVRKPNILVSCPIWRWDNNHVVGFLSSQEIEENPVYVKLRNLGAPEWSQRVGLVVDGNAAEYGRYSWLRAGWPELWNELCEVLPRLKEWR